MIDFLNLAVYTAKNYFYFSCNLRCLLFVITSRFLKMKNYSIYSPSDTKLNFLFRNNKLLVSIPVKLFALMKSDDDFEALRIYMLLLELTRRSKSGNIITKDFLHRFVRKFDKQYRNSTSQKIKDFIFLLQKHKFISPKPYQVGDYDTYYQPKKANYFIINPLRTLVNSDYYVDGLSEVIDGLFYNQAKDVIQRTSMNIDAEFLLNKKLFVEYVGYSWPLFVKYLINNMEVNNVLNKPLSIKDNTSKEYKDALEKSYRLRDLISDIGERNFKISIMSLSMMMDCSKSTASMRIKKAIEHSNNIKGKKSNGIKRKRHLIRLNDKSIGEFLRNKKYNPDYKLAYWDNKDGCAYRKSTYIYDLSSVHHLFRPQVEMYKGENPNGCYYNQITLAFNAGVQHNKLLNVKRLYDNSDFEMKDYYFDLNNSEEYLKEVYYINTAKRMNLKIQLDRMMELHRSGIKPTTVQEMKELHIKYLPIPIRSQC